MVYPEEIRGKADGRIYRHHEQDAHNIWWGEGQNMMILIDV